MKFFPITTFFPFILLPVFFSCSVSKPTSYFKDIKRDTVINTPQNNEALKIKKTDVLSIGISSLSNEEDALFNKQTASAGSTAVSGYALDADGNIQLHKLGRVKAEGLTRNELKNSLEKQLQPFLKDLVVNVNFANHFITIIGEVGKPQILNMPDERMSIVDMVAQSGNINEVAALNNLMIIREKDHSKEFKHISLEDHNIFASPWYYLQPNDVVVVNPDEKRAIQKDRRDRYQQSLSLILQALSLIIIITQIFK